MIADLKAQLAALEIPTGGDGGQTSEPCAGDRTESEPAGGDAEDSEESEEDEEDDEQTSFICSFKLYFVLIPYLYCTLDMDVCMHVD